MPVLFVRTLSITGIGIQKPITLDWKWFTKPSSAPLRWRLLLTDAYKAVLCSEEPQK